MLKPNEVTIETMPNVMEGKSGSTVLLLLGSDTSDRFIPQLAVAKSAWDLGTKEQVTENLWTSRWEPAPTSTAVIDFPKIKLTHRYGGGLRSGGAARFVRVPRPRLFRLTTPPPAFFRKPVYIWSRSFSRQPA